VNDKPHQSDGPPPVAGRLLESLGGTSDFCDEVLGDLAEEYAQRAAWDGTMQARRWYWRETWRVAPYLLRSWWESATGTDFLDVASAAIKGALATTVVSYCIIALEVSLRNNAIHSGVVNAFTLGVAIMPYRAWVLFSNFTFLGIGGWVAARASTRAPAAAVIAYAGGWTALLLTLETHLPGNWLHVASAFRIANSAAILGGIVAGGLLRMLGDGAIRAHDSPRCQLDSLG
jgi:hypothetical protein